jgi:CTD kinase subunit beta
VLRTSLCNFTSPPTVMEAGSSPGPTITARYHHPYYTAVEIETLSEKQRGKRSLHQEEKERQQACAFIEAVGSRMGL